MTARGFSLAAVALLASCSAGGQAPDARAFFGARQSEAAAAQALGLAVDQQPGELVLHDPEPCGARGNYILRQTGGVPVAATAPHGVHDRHTAELARMAYREGTFAAAAWNSVPRRASGHCDGLDLARAADHPFTDFALGFSDRFPDGLIIQFHGFDGDRRESARAADAAMIVSDGTRTPGPGLFALADCLSRMAAPDRVFVYPAETGELGARENAQAAALRDAGGARFAHLEMSLALRETLLADKDLRARLIGCLEEAVA